MNAPLVQISDLTIRFGTHTAVGGVDLTVHPGTCVALVGESGSGKSTIARSVLGLNDRAARVTSKTFTINSEDASVWKERDWRRVRGRFAGLVLQDALVSLDPLRSVRREVTEAVRAGGTARRQAPAWAETLLRDVGFPDPARRSRQFAHQLSGGLRQRALIASALGGSPRLLVADEPTTALDVSVQKQVLDLLARQRDEGLGILLVSHDLAAVAGIADHVIVLRHGQVVEQGPPATLLRSPEQPYVRELVEAIPRLHHRPDRPVPADGDHVVLQADSISVRYQDFTALDDVSLSLARGRTVGVVGQSGSGKSTLLRVLLATQEPQAGTVRLDGEPWSGIPEKARRARRRRLQVVPQDPLSSFDPRWTVRQILAEALAPGTDPVEALSAVSLPAEVLGRRPLELSGGQRQRVAIARALAADPEVLLCDEAVSALDVLVQAQILALLERIRAERGISMVFVSHDLAVVRQVSDEVIVLREGQVVESGPADEVYDRPQHPYTKSLLASLPEALAE
ncbi:ATP-binding cassette domain-containing protein [Kineosporia succinea]|uniref:Peptide/nickel transport system ATP-binding protein n=1 Tax=Kineosporia succinea TaxID=84632 RepID=A0ABT9PC50_9ACTN|nr:ABC transporter ATP-binding protein [Kineosporia succinea]MDP9829580.1 peptide/nickel transport system ATP-binding protein [Kineosporia succinea]